MADDAVGLLDHLDIDRAHIVGASMGGMIAQTIAIAHPERVLSLTSIMSTTGDPDVGQPDPEVLPLLLEAAARPSATPTSPTRCDGQAASAAPSTSTRTRTAARAGLAFDRCFYPAGAGHQLLAIVSSPSRSDGLRRIDINTLVIHGDVDPLVNVSGGERTAEVIPGAELLILEGMGHDLPGVLLAAGHRGHHLAGISLGRHGLRRPSSPHAAPGSHRPRTAPHGHDTTE